MTPEERRAKAAIWVGPHESGSTFMANCKTIRVAYADCDCDHKQRVAAIVSALEKAHEEGKAEGERDGTEKVRAWEASWLAVVRKRDDAMTKHQAAEARVKELEKEREHLWPSTETLAQAKAEGKREGIEAAAKLADRHAACWAEATGRMIRALLTPEPGKDEIHSFRQREGGQSLYNSECVKCGVRWGAPADATPCKPKPAPQPSDTCGRCSFRRDEHNALLELHPFEEKR
jgi:hypothetical protein